MARLLSQVVSFGSESGVIDEGQGFVVLPGTKGSISWLDGLSVVGIEGMTVIGLVVGLVFLMIKLPVFLHLYPVVAFIFFFCFK